MILLLQSTGPCGFLGTESLQWGFAATTFALLGGGFWVIRILLRLLRDNTEAITGFKGTIENSNICSREQTSAFTELTKEIIRRGN